MAKTESPEMHSAARHPLVAIRPTGKRVALDIGSLWSYRELLYFLIWRNVKVRYKQTLDAQISSEPSKAHNDIVKCPA